jgi:glycine/D-amino acid oxidase-like deaminating enzyme
MRTRYGVSYWLDRYPKARQPVYAPLCGETTTQVAVVGGGLAGCACAYAFASAGIRVALLDANRLGQGTTGSGPGLLRLEPPAPFLDLLDRYGQRGASAIWRAYRKAGLDLATTIRRLRLTCEFVRDGSFRAAADEADEILLKREIQALRKAGLEGAWLTAARLKQETGLDGRGAIRSTGDGYTDPYRVAIGLAAAAVRRKGQVFEHTTVTRVRKAEHGVDVITDGGVVHADWVVMAADFPPGAFAPLQRHFRLIESYCALTEPLPSFVRRGFGRSRAIVVGQAHPALVLKRTSDDRLLGMGADQPRLQPRASEKAVPPRTGRIMYELSRLYPTISGVRPEYGWSVPLSVSVDGLPVIGPHRRYPRHLFVLGLGHSGVAAPWLAARMLVRHVQGNPARDDEWFGFGRLR